jgi:hypothetical protein
MSKPRPDFTPDNVNHARYDSDPLVTAVRSARQRRDTADRDLRLLLAYGREFYRPRPVPLAILADAAGFSISGVRTSYGPAEIATVEHLLQLSEAQ